MKKWYLSKELWVAVIAFIGTVVQIFTGFVVDGRIQGLVLSAVMFLLRAFVTDEKIEW